MEQSRRVFLGSAAAAGAAGVGTFAFGTDAFAQRDDSDDGPLVAELARQAKEGVKALRRHPAEGLRRQAAALRALAAHAKGRKLDQLVAQRVRAIIREHGRNTLLIGMPDAAVVNAEWRELGLTVRYVPPVPDTQARGQLIDTLLNGGFSAQLLRFATALETQGAEMDRQGITVLPVQDFNNCAMLSQLLDNANGMQLIFCNPLFGALPPAYVATCAFWTAYAATIWVQMRIWNC